MKLLWKLAFSVGVLVLLTTTVVGLLVSRWTEAVTIEEVRQSLRHQTVVLSETVLQPRPEAELQKIVRRLGADVGTRFTIIREDGVVLADSEGDPQAMVNHADRPEVIEALRAGSGSSTRFSYTIGTRMEYFARAGDGPRGVRLVVRAALPLSLLDELLSRVRDAVLLGSVFGLLIALVPGLLLARRISRPVEQVTEVANAFAREDYTPRVDVGSTRDEIGSLARAFNSMADQLRDRMETIDSDRNKLRAILSSMVEGLVAVDREHRILHMNEVAARILGTDIGTSIGRHVWDVTPMRSVTEILAKTMETNEASNEEVTLTTSPRDQMMLELHAAPLRGAEGSAGALVVIHDVTELRRLEAVRRDFVANVSHELKTPLTAIRAQIETLLDVPDDGVGAETRRRFLERANAQTDRLSTIVRDLLVLSRIESEKAGLELTGLDLRGLVSESVSGLRSAAEEKSIGLTVELPEEAVLVQGDREYLRQVVDNLLSNAIMYTPSGGSVSLRIRLDDGRFALDVVDTGIGIAPVDRERIFERFYRVDKGRSRLLGGTGLGLAIVKHIVMAHGGEVCVESTVGEGSTFSVRLPALAPAET